MMTSADREERNRRLMDRLVSVTLVTQGQMASLSKEHPSTVQRWVKEHVGDGHVVQRSLAGAGRKETRFWPSYAGIVSHRNTPKPNPLRWRSIEEGVETLITRMPVVVWLNDIAIGLGAHDGIRPDGPVHTTLGQFRTQTVIGPDLRLGELIWFDNKPIDAVSIHSGLVWFALKVVGQEMTAHRLQQQAKAIDDWLDPLMARPGGSATPTGWVLLCHDRAAAAHAAEVWPGDNVLVLDVNGRVERTMRPGDFTPPYPAVEPEREIGNPERLGRRRGKDPAQNAPRNEHAYQVFRFLAHFGFATRAQLRQKFGDRYVKAVKELQQQRFVGTSGDLVYLSEPAVQVLSDIDRVDYDTVHGRLSRFVDLKRGTLRNPVHDQALLDIFLTLEAEGLSPAEGSRYAMYLADGSQIVPDLVFCLDRKDGRTLLVFLELELSSTHPQQVLSKARPYVDADWHGVEIASAWVVETEAVRQRYAAAGRDLIMMTAVLHDLLTGTSRGPNSAWRWENSVADIDELAYTVDVEIDAYLERS